jgi:hypothetical protein
VVLDVVVEIHQPNAMVNDDDDWPEENLKMSHHGPRWVGPHQSRIVPKILLQGA